MNKTLLTIFISLAVPLISHAQQLGDTACACKRFPYWFCSGSDKVFAWCTDDPWYDTTTNQAGLGRASVVHFVVPPTCITDDRDNYDCGWFWDGTMFRPGVVGDWKYVPFASMSRTGIGITENPAANEYDQGENLLTAQWRESVMGCATPPGQPYPTRDSGCCTLIHFEQDPSWWEIYGVDVKQPGGGALGMVMNPSVNSDCTRKCDAKDIYINTTNQFFYGKDSIDMGNKPRVLFRSYVAMQPGAKLSPHGDFYGGVWYDWNLNAWNYDDVTVPVYNAYDWYTIIMHEMGHVAGLPDRSGKKCLNTGGQYCGDWDPNSVMRDTINPGDTRPSGSPDDCCWLRKLYYHSSLPGCPGDPWNIFHKAPPSEVGALVEPFDMQLGQSHPNPASGAVAIEFSMGRSMPASFEIYDILGKTMLSLMHNIPIEAGSHAIEIPAGSLPSGKYIYSLRAGDRVLSKTMTILR